MAEKKYSYSGSRLSQGIPRGISNLPIPSSDLCFEEIFDFPFIENEETVDYLSNHGRVMFIIRGPSGTRKHRLMSIITTKYPSSEICCADGYFSEPFAPATKTHENIKKSHEYCEEKALKACQEGKHPIVIKNTHIKKWEMQYYINLATEYCYVTIMIVTLRKLRVEPKILEMTNTQGLKKPYLGRRLCQWEECVPLYTGWMLSPIDTLYLMREYNKCLKTLSELDDFCKHCEGSAKDFFTPEKFPFCIATYCHNGRNPSALSYYLSLHVQTMYGKVFPVTIQAFVITKSLTAAVVCLSQDMKTLVSENKEDVHDLSDDLSALSVHDGVKPQKPLCDYMTNYLQTFAFCSRPKNEKIDTNNCTFIVLSTAIKDSPKYPYIENVSKFSEALFSSKRDSDGKVSTSSFHTLENKSKYCRLSSDSWLILPSKNITVKSVFTGMYI